MDISHLTKGNCVSCEGGVDKSMEEKEAKKYRSFLKQDWEFSDDKKSISLQFKLKSFIEAMNFVNKVAKVAEEQGHHPDIYICYNKVEITLTTHAIKGLSVNDFIMASKIELLDSSL